MFNDDTNKLRFIAVAMVIITTLGCGILGAVLLKSFWYFLLFAAGGFLISWINALIINAFCGLCDDIYQIRYYLLNRKSDK